MGLIKAPKSNKKREEWLLMAYYDEEVEEHKVATVPVELLVESFMSMLEEQGQELYLDKDGCPLYCIEDAEGNVVDASTMVIRLSNDTEVTE